MKKFLFSFILAFLLSSVYAIAGTNETASLPNNGKEAGNTAEQKTSSTYNFTLFNFFTGNQGKVKVDSVKTEPKNTQEKAKNSINSDL